MEGREFYAIEDHVSLIPENVETFIKVETDIMDDYVWESTIEISSVNYVNDQYNVELPLESQVISL